MLLKIKNKYSFFHFILSLKKGFPAFLSLVSCILCLASSFAQTIDSTSYSQYKFIKKELNKIENDSSSLTFFYEKLYQLEQTKKGRVNVVHIGDSHIQ
ncbi:MAG: hypothetical protein ACXVPU_17765, partial [Bacteroidia bacterium]